MQRYALLFIGILLSAALDARLLVSVDDKAPFSAEQLAEKTQAALVEIETRNPFKALHKVFVDEPFIVLSLPFDDERVTLFDDRALRMLGYAYGYRTVHFKEQSLEEAAEIAQTLLKSIPHKTSQLEPLKEQESLDLYNLAAKIDIILTKHGVHYWAGRETLLGAVQCKGLRPWDDYLHFFIMDSADDELKALAEEFEAAGLCLHHYWKDFYKIYEKEGKVLEDKYHPGQILPFRYPAANIFVMSLEKRNEGSDVYVHRSEHFYKYWSFDRFDYEQIATLTRANFGPIMLPIPQDPERYFDRVFGRPGYPDLWKRYAQERLFDHRIEFRPDYPGAAFVEIDVIEAAPW